MAEVNLCSWGKGKMGCVVEIKSLFASFVESFPLDEQKQDETTFFSIVSQFL